MKHLAFLTFTFFLAPLFLGESFSSASAQTKTSKQAAAKAPAIWGQVVKTNKELYGHEYFVTFKEEGQNYAYPLSNESQLGEKEIQKMVGKYAKIKGKTKFEKRDVGESKYLMTFRVEEITPLTFKDLNENMPSYADRLTVKRYIGEGAYRSETYTHSIDDKTANTAILVGGAVLAAEVLANILNPPN